MDEGESRATSRSDAAPDRLCPDKIQHRGQKVLTNAISDMENGRDTPFSAAHRFEELNRIFTGFAGPDSDGCFYGGHKYFAVTDASSSGCLADGFNRKVYSIVE